MKPKPNQQPLFLQPAPGTDCGLQSTDLGGQLFHQSLPTEATSEAARILQEQARLKVQFGQAYGLYMERQIQESATVGHYFDYLNERG